MGQKKPKGLEAFESFYKEIYGARWDELRTALCSVKKVSALINPYSKESPKGDMLWDGVLEAPSFERPSGEPLNYYLLDAASVLCARALKASPEHKVLDMCAAPGGKSLAIQFQRKEGELVSNELSRDRRTRLRRVLDDYIPKELQENIRVTGFDATTWCLHEKEAFDRILLDAPCSSERHLLESPDKLVDWKGGRSKRLSKLQYSLLASATQVLRPGGRIVYSTCSISPLENDKVVERLFKKRPEGLKLVKEELLLGQQTEFGTIILPDKDGWGPLYIAIIEKEDV
ncbi:MAG: RNA methyltransferase [Halobacteriovorax sp.]|nr:RNA methyltransferase [Halobacteriovorax sp.]|tara:strand:- start:197285 stop:198145 length:861 start_codon:yes stop_codon:yes gene_type:complete